MAPVYVMQQDEDEEEEVKSINEVSFEEMINGLDSKENENKNNISTQESRRQLIWKLTQNHPVLKQWHHQD